MNGLRAECIKWVGSGRGQGSPLRQYAWYPCTLSPLYPPSSPRRRLGGLPSPQNVHMLVGMDPGCSAMFTAVDEHGNSTRCLTREYHVMAGHTERHRKMAGWLDHAPSYVQEYMQAPTRKTACGETLLRHIAWRGPRLRGTLEWALHKHTRQQRFRVRTLEDRALSTLANQFRAPRGMTTVVGAGDWRNGNPGGWQHRVARGPWLRFLKYLARVCLVVVVVEYNTSKLCCGCRTRLRPHKYPQRTSGGGQEPGGWNVWGTKRCANPACLIDTIDRDVSAAVNMLFLLKLLVAGQPRPEVFGGPPSQGRPSAAPAPSTSRA